MRLEGDMQGKIRVVTDDAVQVVRSSSKELRLSSGSQEEPLKVSMQKRSPCGQHSKRQ